MSLNVTFNGSNYIIPETGEVGWGGNTTSYLVAIAAGALQKTGGSFLLSAETDFGASFGLKSVYYKSASSNVASTGVLRLNNNSDSINWRNAANTLDLVLTVNASDQLLFNGVPLAGSTVTANRALISNGSGIISAAITTATEIGYVNGVVSPIQTQLNLKAPLASPTFTGTVTVPVTASRALVTGATSELTASLTTAVEIGYVNGVTSAIQTQLDSMVEKSEIFVNVKDFGATGDGVTDDTAAIQAAHDSIVSSGVPQVLYLPGGTYLCSSTLTFNIGYVSVHGDYAVLDFKAAISASDFVAVQVIGAGLYVGTPWYQGDAVIEGIRIEGPTKDDGNGTGLYFYSATAATSPAHVMIRDVTVMGLKHGIRIGSNAYLLKFHGVQSIDNIIGVYAPTTNIDASPVTNSGENISFIGGAIFACTNAMSIANGSADFNFTGMSIDYNGSTNILLTNGQLAFYGCHFEGTTKIILASSNTFSSFTDCVFIGVGDQDKFLENAGFMTIHSGRIAVSNASTNIVESTGRLVLIGTHFQTTSSSPYTVSGNWLVYLPNVGTVDTSGNIQASQFIGEAVYVEDGTAASPTLSWFSDSNTGFYRTSNGRAGFSSNGTLEWQFDNDITGMGTANRIYTTAGTAALPTHSFTSDPNSGLYSVGADILGLATNGVKRLEISTTAITPTLQLLTNFLGGLASPDYSWDGDSDSGLTRLGANNIALGTNGIRAIEITSSQAVNIKGTSTNNNAASGDVGEYIASTASTVNAPTSGQYGDLTSISLTAGDWDVSLFSYWEANGATWTEARSGISTTSGNSATGLNTNSNLAIFRQTSSATAVQEVSPVVPSYRISLSSTTTVYLKYFSSYTVGTPRASGRLSARRIR